MHLGLVRSGKSGRFLVSFAASFALSTNLLFSGCGLMSPNDNERERLADAMRRWDSHGFESYQYELRRVCGECAPGWRNLLRIRVRSDQIEEVVDITTGRSVILPDERARTIPQLFTHIRQALDVNPYRFSAEYHSQLGYPTSFAIDYDRNTVDDEGGFIAANLVVLP